MAWREITFDWAGSIHNINKRISAVGLNWFDIRYFNPLSTSASQVQLWIGIWLKTQLSLTREINARIKLSYTNNAQRLHTRIMHTIMQTYLGLEITHTSRPRLLNEDELQSILTIEIWDPQSKETWIIITYGVCIRWLKVLPL